MNFHNFNRKKDFTVKLKFAGVPTFKNNRRFERKFAPRVILPRCGRKKFYFLQA
ncbi:hypothetical protein LEP1GSC018_1257 [Leptospira kirschneri str. 2008720114]|nr:hypothetical protein LEP1GSC018_1257 [Leptospira kirschneri str. 2008720114]EMK14246.1 hypothetical protein LEP1GSC042_3286 [Leptospira kirschneri serovar Bim str. PUO 1247]